MYNFLWKNIYKMRIQKKRNIPLHYWDKKFGDEYNIGDLFSLLIVRKFSGKPVVHVSEDSPLKFCAIGSIISNSRLKTGGLFWGSGMLEHAVQKYRTPAAFTAVRGPLTRKSLLTAGYKCPDIYGDPALLLPRIYTPQTVTKKYKIGVICHWRHKNLIRCEDGVKFISILRSEEKAWEFIDEICQCDMVLSSSLHGIIIANAYGIPAKQMIFEGYPLEGDSNKKFVDYYMSVGMPIQEPFIMKGGGTISEYSNITYDSMVDLKINLNKLYAAFPFG